MPSQPIWRVIHDSIRADIVEGRYRTGDRLPTEKALSERFRVNRHTVRRALADLTAAGMISVRRGSGAYVAEGMIDYRLGGSVKFSQNILQIGRTPFHRLMHAEVAPADDRVAAQLGLASGALVARLDTISEANGDPVLYAHHHFPDERFPGFIEAFRAEGSFSAALRRYGVDDYRRAWTRVTAQPPSRKVAAHLRQLESQPVLRAEGLNLDLEGRPIEFAVGWWAGSRAQFVVEGG